MKLTFFPPNTEVLPKSLVQINMSDAHFWELTGAEDSRCQGQDTAQ